MRYRNSILKQILQIIPRYEFDKSVKKHNGEFASKGFTCWEQDVITFDSSYTDFKLFVTYCNEGVYFVTRLKKNSDYSIEHA